MKKGKNALNERGVVANRLRLESTVVAEFELKRELLNRRIGMSGVRDARPLKQQRQFAGR